MIVSVLAPVCRVLQIPHHLVRRSNWQKWIRKGAHLEKCHRELMYQTFCHGERTVSSMYCIIVLITRTLSCIRGGCETVYNTCNYNVHATITSMQPDFSYYLSVSLCFYFHHPHHYHRYSAYRPKRSPLHYRFPPPPPPPVSDSCPSHLQYRHPK